MSEPKPKDRFHLGDTVVVHRSYRADVTGIVEKIGRTLVHVRTNPGKWGVETFVIATGLLQNGSGTWVRTLEEDAAHKREADLRDRLKAHGLSVSTMRTDDGPAISLDDIEAIVTLMDARRAATPAAE